MGARELEGALRSNMHWVLPGRDRRGRRIVVYNARALLSSAHSVEELQMSLCLLLERLFSGDHGGVRGDTEEEEDSDGDRTARRGVVVVCDCRGVASLSALLAAKKQRTPSKDARKGARADATHATHATKAASKAALGLEDVHRGCAMMAESFPCRLRGLYVLNLPLALRPFAALAAAACLTRKQRGRLHISSSSSSSLGNIFGGSVVSSGNSSGSSSGSGSGSGTWQCDHVAIVAIDGVPDGTHWLTAIADNHC